MRFELAMPLLARQVVRVAGAGTAAVALSPRSAPWVRALGPRRVGSELLHSFVEGLPVGATLRVIGLG